MFVVQMIVRGADFYVAFANDGLFHISADGDHGTNPAYISAILAAR
jgi:hypothetical protein